LLEAMLLLPLFWVGLRLFGLAFLHSWVMRPIAAGRRSCTDIAPAGIGTLVNLAGNHLPFPSSCLTRSLLLVWLLGRRGAASDLRIGVRPAPGGIDAHAWVEHEGRPVNDALGVSARFAVFDQLTPLGPGPSR
jgi:hypothetical protein